MPGDVFLDLVKAAWKAAHNLVIPPVMAEARDMIGKEGADGALFALQSPIGHSL